MIPKEKNTEYTLFPSANLDDEFQRETELSYKEKDASDYDWVSLYSYGKEITIDAKDIRSGVEYVCRVRFRFVRTEDKSPVTDWGPWSEVSVVKIPYRDHF